MKNPKSEYGISRVDNERSRTHGWLVTVQRRGVIHRRHFSDGTCGGKNQSLAAARSFRDEIVAKYPPFSMREYSSIVKKNNRSGVVGVCRYCATETRDLPEEQQRWSWVASWPTSAGKRMRVKFSIKKFGEEQAFKLALKARRDALKGLEGNFVPGRKLHERAIDKRTRTGGTSTARHVVSAGA